VSSALKSDGYSAFTRVRPGTLRKGLVVVQLTVSLVLLIAASVLLRTAIRLQLHDPGYSVDRIVAAGIPAQQQNAPDVHALIAERLSRMPQVLSLAFSWRLPLSGRLRLVPVALAQMPDSRIPAGFNHVSPAYFETLRIPLVQGRTFTAQEARLEANVAVVSAALAARLWPNDAPVGQYLPLHEQGHLLVRVDGDPRTTSEQIRLQFASIDPYLHVGVRPLSDTIDAQLIPFRIASGIAMVIGLLGLTLSAIGVYGVMSYGVVQRTQEIGVRMALGAERQDVLWMILRESLRLTAIGCSVGVGLAFAFCRVLAGFVPNFLEFDSASFTLAPLGLALVALLATLLPARRAAQVDPMITLRYE